ncbi:MAG: hypothetical protein Fur0035_11970 [Anaerolineales bacterium]
MQTSPDFDFAESVDFKALLGTLRRWAWLLVAGLMLGASLAALLSILQKPVYRASTKVLVTKATQSQPADISGAINLQQTADTYVQFLGMEPVLDLVAQRVGGEIAPEAIRASLVQNTQIINVTADDTDPARAAKIADTLVQVLIEQNEILQAGRYTDAEASLLVQKTDMEAKIQSIQNELNQANQSALQEQTTNILAKIDETQKELDSLAAGPEISTEKTERIRHLQLLLSDYQEAYNTLIVTGKVVGQNDKVTQLEKSYNLYQQLYLNLLSNLESVRMARLQNTPNVVQISQATVADKPVSPRTTLNTALGGLAGLILAFLTVFLIEYFDDTLKSSEELEKAFGLAVIGHISEVSAREQKLGNLNVAAQPRAPIAEAFRSIRANLEFAGVDKPLKTILLTSPGPAEGKSTLAANLATIIAQGGKRVSLVDADLRRPSLHRIFGLSNRAGLTDLFRERQPLKNVVQIVGENHKISVITTGSLPPNPTELLASEKMNSILEELKKSSDMVVVDSAPAIVADAQVLSAKVDGVLLVIQPGKTHRAAIRATLEQLKRAGANVIGVIFNRISASRMNYYSGYGQYQYHYQYSPSQPAEESKNS